MSSKLRSLRRDANKVVSVPVPKRMDRDRVKATLTASLRQADEYLSRGDPSVHVLTLRDAHVTGLRPFLLLNGAQEGLMGPDMAELCGVVCRASFGTGPSDAEAFNRMRLLGVLTWAHHEAIQRMGRVSADIANGELRLSHVPTEGAEPVSVRRPLEWALSALAPDDKGIVWRMLGRQLATMLETAVAERAEPATVEPTPEPPCGGMTAAQMAAAV